MRHLRHAKTSSMWKARSRPLNSAAAEKQPSLLDPIDMCCCEDFRLCRQGPNYCSGSNFPAIYRYTYCTPCNVVAIERPWVLPTKRRAHLLLLPPPPRDLIIQIYRISDSDNRSGKRKEEAQRYLKKERTEREYIKFENSGFEFQVAKIHIARFRVLRKSSLNFLSSPDFCFL